MTHYKNVSKVNMGEYQKTNDISHCQQIFTEERSKLDYLRRLKISALGFDITNEVLRGIINHSILKYRIRNIS